ncbi:MAG: hypothetical protein JST92_08675 [Deltaproteobacteria bacterium]|nr:hypothetical protein [Deltaproteobacteria bacterium]
MTSSRLQLFTGAGLSLLLAAAAAHALAQTYQQRREAAYAEATAERHKLNLDSDVVKLYATYPTPELQFAGETSRVQLHPGESAQVKLTGKFAAGTKFLLTNDALVLSEEKIGKGEYSAKITAPANALPGNAVIEAMSPVSAASMGLEVVQVIGSYALSLKFADGWAVDLKPVQADDSQIIFDATWTKPGQPTRHAKAAAEQRPDRRLSSLPTDDESKVQQENMQKQVSMLGSPETQAAMKDFTTAMEKCQKGPQAELSACMQKAGEKMKKAQEALEQKRKALVAEGDKKLPQGAPRCNQLSLKAEGNKVSGEAECADDQRLAVTGTYKSVPMK